MCYLDSILLYFQNNRQIKSLIIILSAEQLRLSKSRVFGFLRINLIIIIILPRPYRKQFFNTIGDWVIAVKYTYTNNYIYTTTHVTCIIDTTSKLNCLNITPQKRTGTRPLNTFHKYFQYNRLSLTKLTIKLPALFQAVRSIFP